MPSGSPAEATADVKAHGSTSVLLRRVRLGMVCCCMVAISICGAGVYTFPLLSAALVERLRFTQPQLSTIVTAAIVCQYVASGVVGQIIDKHGTRVSAFLASGLYTLGFGLFARELSIAPTYIDAAPPAASFYRVVLSFALIGLGTVTSYFTVLFAATRILPAYSGIAAGTSLSLFGLSAMFLSMVATHFFTHTATGLDAQGYATFLAIMTGAANLAGSFVLPGVKEGVSSSVAVAVVADGAATIEGGAEDTGERSLSDSEEQPLLGDLSWTHESRKIPEPEDLPTSGLVKDPSFWLLALVGSLMIGAGDMVKTNIGLVVLSLPPSAHSTAEVISRQVELISIANTAARLLSGPIADVIAPVPCYSAAGVWSLPRKRYMSRMLFLTGSAILLTVVFLVMVTGIRDREALWPFSIGIGIVYGTVNTIVPSIVSAAWGLKNHARNFGLLGYATFVGFPLFSFLYAFVAESHTAPGENVCHGVQCWRTTFSVCAGAALVSTTVSLIVWLRWNARV